MRATLAAIVAAVAAAPAHAHGLLIPEDKSVPPLAMVNHHVRVAIEDQVAETTVEQSFRNHTDRQLEATYVFPVPKGASVNRFSMWVDGKEVAGELLKADEARQIYTDIVRRTQDPALLEYMDGDILRLRIFPVPPRADQKVKLSFTSISQRDHDVVEYVYPLKSNKQPVSLLEDFSVRLTLKSQKPLQSVYSPTHAIDVVREGDHAASIEFEREEAQLNQDFQLFYSVGDDAIGLTMVPHRPVSAEDGFFLLMLSPQIEAARENRVPRDVVMVVDTSGSMDGVKMSQARKAVRHVLDNLDDGDRFGLVSFATTVRTYRDELLPAEADRLAQARDWVNDLRAGGGTAIQPALDEAFRMRTSDSGRSFTVIFFTDGQPTIGEMKPENILKRVEEKAGDQTRIFSFGVGDDVNAALLDRLAEHTRALSTYVRPAEDIAVKVSSLYDKIRHPVLADVRLTTSENVTLHEIYPPELPDLFHGSQLVVLGRYTGQGSAAITLSGRVGETDQEFVYESAFPQHSAEDREFVEHLWARRKVGFLLDQVRVNGEQKELIDELMALSKRYGIATPYTSYLVVPDAPLPAVRAASGAPAGDDPNQASGALLPPGLSGAGGIGGGFGGGSGGGFGPGGGTAEKVIDYARRNQAVPAEGGRSRAHFEADRLDRDLKELAESPPADDRPGREGLLKALKDAKLRTETYSVAGEKFEKGAYRETQAGKLGVDLAVCANNLKWQKKLEQTAMRNVAGRNCMEIGGVWIDEGFAADQEAVVVKAQSDAYFRILEKRPEMKEVFQLGNHLVYLTPSNKALVIDTSEGEEKISDEEIDKLFVAMK